jgi:hypothetical protein
VNELSKKRVHLEAKEAAEDSTCVVVVRKLVVSSKNRRQEVNFLNKIILTNILLTMLAGWLDVGGRASAIWAYQRKCRSGLPAEEGNSRIGEVAGGGGRRKKGTQDRTEKEPLEVMSTGTGNGRSEWMEKEGDGRRRRQLDPKFSHQCIREGK